MTVKGRGLVAPVSNANIANDVSAGKYIFGRASKAVEAGLIASEPRPVDIERPRRVLVHLHGGFPGFNHIGEECDKLAPDGSVLLLNMTPIAVRLCEGLKTESSVLDVVNDLRIEDCQFWSNIQVR